jgi:hypothetical protein
MMKERRYDMAKKEEQLMGNLLAIVPSDMKEMVPYGLAVNANAPLTKTEERIVQEKRKQELVIEGQREKVIHALQSASEIHQHAADEFYKSMSHHAAINEAVRGKEMQPLVEEFNHFAAKLEAQHLYRIVDAGVHLIGQEVSRSLYLPDVPEEKKRKGWFS